jgi:iron(III) transport system ATP-binding protein
MNVSFHDIEQSYGGHALFTGFDLTIPSGSFFTLLGPSGCGKTTLLRMLAGFVRPDKGRIFFGEEDVTAIPVHRRGVGMVFQDYALFPDRSILANVCYGLDARGVSKSEARARAMAMLERVGLQSMAERAPAALSGGQRQRVAMARALVIQPKVLLLDEPLSALDVKLRVELRTMVRDLQLEAGITAVFVTHDQEEALAISDQIAVMDKGRVVQIGTPHQVYSAPVNAFAADFVGSANLIRISKELPTAGNTRRLQTEGGTVLLTHSAGAIVDGAALAVRSEEITLADDGPVAEGQLIGVIESAEFRGSITGYTVRTAVGPIRVDTWSGQQGHQRERGSSVVLSLPKGAALVGAF